MCERERVSVCVQGCVYKDTIQGNIYKDTYKGTHTHTGTHTCARERTHTHARAHTRTHAHYSTLAAIAARAAVSYIYTFVLHTHTHTHKHTHTHTHTQTNTQKRALNAQVEPSRGGPSHPARAPDRADEAGAGEALYRGGDGGAKDHRFARGPSHSRHQPPSNHPPTTFQPSSNHPPTTLAEEIPGRVTRDDGGSDQEGPPGQPEEPVSLGRPGLHQEQEGEGGGQREGRRRRCGAAPSSRGVNEWADQELIATCRKSFDLRIWGKKRSI